MGWNEEKELGQDRKQKNLFSVYRRIDSRLSHSITLFLVRKAFSLPQVKRKFPLAYEIQQLLETSSSLEVGRSYSELHT